MRVLLWILLAANAAPVLAAEPLWRVPIAGETLTGVTARGETLYVWGRAAWRLDSRRPRLLARPPHGYHDGGCALASGLVLAERPAEGALGRLVHLAAPDFKPELIDTGVELHDCLPATLFGREGFLMVHRFAQVRFYWRENGAWAQVEIYSIYTASRQGGLALADVDGDGLPDLYCGNYWVRSPESLDLPWRIFAINLHHAEPDAANFLFAGWPGELWAAQRERGAQRLRVFTRPANPRELWPESAGPALDRPRAVLATAPGQAVIAHAPGLLFWPANRTIDPGHPVAGLAQLGAAVAAAGGDTVTAWPLQPRK